MDKSEAPRMDKSQAPEPRPYEPPRLRVLGTLSELTHASGTPTSVSPSYPVG